MKRIDGIKFFSISEIAQMMYFSYELARQYVRDGHIPGCRIGKRLFVSEITLMKMGLIAYSERLPFSERTHHLTILPPEE